MKNENKKYKKTKFIVTRMNNKVLKKERMKKIIFCMVFIFTILFMINSANCATDPTLVTKINSALKKIQGYLVKFATPAAGVAIASGVLMRKFSFGNEEKMTIGKKVIINAIIGYAIVLSIDLIIKFVDSLI